MWNTAFIKQYIVKETVNGYISGHFQRHVTVPDTLLTGYIASSIWL